MGIRTGEEYDQSLISTILILPVVVTGIVIIVQNSLALAFALAGIAGAVRFKNSLKSSGDALFILISVGTGLAAGIGAVELAIVMGLGFNYCFLLLWATEYGEREGMKRYMADLDPTNCRRRASAAAPTPTSPPPLRHAAAALTADAVLEDLGAHRCVGGDRRRRSRPG